MKDKAEGWEWKGKVIATMGSIMDIVFAITTKEEAKEFLEEYRKHCDKPEYADSNIGYCAGYGSQEEAKRIWDLFDVSHPIFGRAIPTPKEAFETGVKLGKEMKKNEATK